MSERVREWLNLLGLHNLTNHEDRLEIDREIERRTGVECDEAIDSGLISSREFEEIVMYVVKRKKKMRVMEVYA